MIAKNALSDAALVSLLHSGLRNFNTTFRTLAGFNLGTSGAVTAIGTGQQVDITGSPLMGVYALGGTYDWTKRNFRAPYVHNNCVDLNNDVTFYSTGNNVTETQNLLGQVVNRSQWQGNRRSFRTEFVKSVGNAGTFQSLCFGTAHSAILTNTFWGLTYNEPGVFPFFAVTRGRGNIVLEHKLDRTLMHYVPSQSGLTTTSAQYSIFDMLTKSEQSNVGISALLAPNTTVAYSVIVRRYWHASSRY